MRSVRKPKHVVALLRAIEIAGGQAALAERISNYPGAPRITQQGVSRWVNDNIKIAAEYWPALEAITSQEITREHLRPDVFSSQHVA